MTQKQFDEIINFRIAKTKELLLVKGKEYIRNNDPLHNFNRAALMNKETPIKSLHGMLTKHLVSYLDMLNDIEANKLPKIEYVDEKIGDIITYFHLAEACIKKDLIDSFYDNTVFLDFCNHHYILKYKNTYLSKKIYVDLCSKMKQYKTFNRVEATLFESLYEAEDFCIKNCLTFLHV